jgi:kinesin family protein 18/19
LLRRDTVDHVFGPKVGQEEVFQTLAKPLVDVVLGGFNATVFAYGQTGSGKTHTMLGEKGEPGIMGRTLMELFRFGHKASFQVSFIELYNEEIRDLLTPGNSSGSGPGLDLREDPVRGSSCLALMVWWR